MTAAAQLQGAGLTTGRRRRSDHLTTFETLTFSDISWVIESNITKISKKSFFTLVN